MASRCVVLAKLKRPPSNPYTSQEGEYDYDFSPAWRYVATHMHWTERLEAISDLYLRAAFGLQPDQLIPPVSYHRMYFICRNASLIDMRSTLPFT